MITIFKYRYPGLLEINSHVAMYKVKSTTLLLMQMNYSIMTNMSNIYNVHGISVSFFGSVLIRYLERNHTEVEMVAHFQQLLDAVVSRRLMLFVLGRIVKGNEYSHRKKSNAQSSARRGCFFEIVAFSHAISSLQVFAQQHF